MIYNIIEQHIWKKIWEKKNCSSSTSQFGSDLNGFDMDYVNFSVLRDDLFAAVPCDTRPSPPLSCHYRSSSFAMALSPASVSIKALLELQEVSCHKN